MPPVYVVEQNTKLRIRNQRLEVERVEDDAHIETLLSVPLGQVSQVILFGNVGLTTPAIDALLGEGREVIFLTRNGEYRGRLIGEITPHVPLRRAQYARLNEPHFVLALAKRFVHAKLSHQRALLLRHNRQRSDPLIHSAAEQLAQALEAVERKQNLASLRGLEGSATAAYFGGLRRLFDPVWRFEKRTRRPPADPVNVLLSFGYTLMAQTASGAVQSMGLDPYAGFLHEYAYNRPALALDLLEEFRPVVDGVALWACASGQITPQDFEPGPPERPVLLLEDGLKRFIRAYETRMEGRFTHPLRGVQLAMRQCVFEQARQAADCIQQAKPDFRGMGFR
ncbi:MAG: CRISPR-associated endonuclease Cas1 [Anaerolineae bacterium]|nr:CRISPR-associated endonuclease Cas1 [Anaerolineae bacterium]